MSSRGSPGDYRVDRGRGRGHRPDPRRGAARHRGRWGSAAAGAAGLLAGGSLRCRRSRGRGERRGVAVRAAGQTGCSSGPTVYSPRRCGCSAALPRSSRSRVRRRWRHRSSAPGRSTAATSSPRSPLTSRSADRFRGSGATRKTSRRKRWWRSSHGCSAIASSRPSPRSTPTATAPWRRTRPGRLGRTRFRGPRRRSSRAQPDAITRTAPERVAAARGPP